MLGGLLGFTSSFENNFYTVTSHQINSSQPCNQNQSRKICSKTKNEKSGNSALIIFNRSYKYLFSYSKIINLIFVRS